MWQKNPGHRPGRPPTGIGPSIITITTLTPTSTMMWAEKCTSIHRGEWRVSASLPAGVRLDVHSYTVLDMDADKPYVYHGEVAKRYPPGQLKKADKGKGKKGD